MKILICISAGIAAYKIPFLIRLLKKQNHSVRVIMTKNAEQVVTPLTLATLSENKVYSDLFAMESESTMGHIDLARWADEILVTPATANIIAKIAHGFADDLVTSVLLATKKPITVAPAMNKNMWENEATQNNIQILKKRHIKIIGPEEGEQACGDVGYGRMLEPHVIARSVSDVAISSTALRTQTILITAGPTQEAIDPVRYLTNRSTGKMGYALAEAAKEAGYKVILVSGPTKLTPPTDITIIKTTSADDMYQAVMENINQANIFIAAAAVADYKPLNYSNNKIKKQPGEITISLRRNPDILKSVSQLKNKPYLIGFAAETDNLIENAKKKLTEKNCNMIVANLISDDNGFAVDDNQVVMVTPNDTQALAKMCKQLLAKHIIAKLESKTPLII